METLWPLVVGCCYMLLAGGSQAVSGRIPNGLNVLFLAGAIATVSLSHFEVLALHGGFVSMLVGLGVGGAVLLPLYSNHRLGAGCVKAQAVFSAWVGCATSVPVCLATSTAVALLATSLMLCGASLAYFVQADEARRGYLFPAQVLLSFGSIGATALIVVLAY